jgi:hypothetical protein
MNKFYKWLLDSRAQLRFLRAFLFYFGTLCLILCFSNIFLLCLGLCSFAGIALVNSQLKDEEENNN